MMLRFIYQIEDSSTLQRSPLFFANTDVGAKREFEHFLRSNSEIRKLKDSYVLYRLGAYSEESGVITECHSRNLIDTGYDIDIEETTHANNRDNSASYDLDSTLEVIDG